MQSHLGVAVPKMKKKHLRSRQDLAKAYQVPVDISTVNAKHEAQPVENARDQLVLYSSGALSNGEGIVAVPDPTKSHTTSFRSFLVQNGSTRVLPSVGAFTVQCASCFKWRFIPTKEKYEELRQNILEEPFVCERAREWRPDVSCDDPADISQDGSRLWAIDKPNIAQPPPGWERLLRIRGEGSSKFADIYYVAPSGKRLRSMVEVERYLFEHPEYIRQGVNLTQFSFIIPKPLQDNYVRKRNAGSTHLTTTDGDGTGMPRPLEPGEVSWAGHPTQQESQNGAGLLTPCYDPPAYYPPVDQRRRPKLQPIRRSPKEKLNNPV